MRKPIRLLLLVSAFIFIQNIHATSLHNANPNSLSVAVDSLVAPTCAGNDGEIHIEITGGTAPYSFIWSNGDTTEDPTGLPSGIYSVTVTDSESETVELEGIALSNPTPPVAAIEGDGDLTCSHPVVQLNGSTSNFNQHTIYHWTAPNGVAFNSPTDTLIVFVAAGGTYFLTLTDTLNGCTAVAQYTILVDTLQPTVNAGPNEHTHCSNDEISLAGTATADPAHVFTVQWSAFNGGSILANGDELTAQVNHIGTYVLTITIIENGCSATDTTFVTSTHEAPNLAVTGDTITCFSPDAQLIAEADTIDAFFGWTGPNGFISNELTTIVATVGDYIFTVTDTITGCSSSGTALVLSDLEAPVINATGGIINCSNPSVTLSFASSVPSISVAWTGPNSFHSTVFQPLVTEAGDYELTVTDTLNGCSATAIASVTGNAIPPIADAGANGMLTCAVTSLSIGGLTTSQGPEFVYDWTTANGNIINGENAITATVNASGGYSLKVTNTLNGCTAEDQVLVSSNTTPPSVTALGGIITCTTPTIALQGIFNASQATYGWTGPNGYTSVQQNPTVSTGGTYVLTITSTVNGCTNSASTTVVVSNSAPGLQASGGTVGCNGTPALIHAYAQGNNVTFQWSGPGNFTSTQQHPSVTLPGSYAVTATDGLNGCKAIAVAVVNQNTTPPVAVANGGGILGCNVTSIKLNGNGSSIGIGIGYLWTTANGNIVSGGNTISPTVNAPGTYKLTVTNTLNGCTASATTTVTPAQPITIQLSITDAICYGAANGAATATAIGGNGTISYRWSNGVQAPFAYGLTAGAYTITVSDANGCTATATANIGQPTSALSVAATATNQTNPAINNGTASASASGGTSPYLFAWSNGSFNQTITGLAPGAYSVTVTDQHNCSTSITVNVNAAACILGASVSSTTNIACFGNSSGAATVSVSNASNPIKYTWSNGTMTTTQTISGLAAGQYGVTVSDNSGCSVVLSFQITQPTTAISLSELNHVNVPCASGSNTGTITAAVSGGTQPYNFAWSNGSSTATINNLGAGNYHLTVTDSKGCKANLTSTIIVSDTEPPTLSLKNVTISLNANGQATVNASQFNNGSTDNCGIASWTVSQTSFNCNHLGTNTVTVTATDVNGLQRSGTAQVIVEDNIVPTLTCPSNINISACSGTVTFSLPSVADNCGVNASLLTQTAGLSSGAIFPAGVTNQTFIYTDASGNTGTCSFQVTVSSSLSYSVTQLDESCAGACDGRATLNISGGQQPVNIVWSNGGDGTSLCAGSYSATIIDASGCTQVVNVSIGTPAPLSLSLSETAPDCPGNLSGSIQTIATGGAGGYQFAWSNGSTAQNLSGIGTGTYNVVVTDAAGCSSSQSISLVAHDTEAPTLLLQNASIGIGQNGSAPLTPNMFDAGSYDNCGIASWSIIPSTVACGQIGLQPVTITVTDVNGNNRTGSASVMVTDNIAPIITCPDNVSAGACDPVVSFNQPIVTDNCAINPAQLIQVSGLSTGSIFPIGTSTLAYTYTDAAGNLAACSFTLTVSPAPVLTSAYSNITCHGECDGAASVTISGGQTPFNVVWNNGQTGTAVSGLCAGNYAVMVTDANGCEQTLDFNIIEPPLLEINVEEVINDLYNSGTGAIGVSVAGGTLPYDFAWSLNGIPFSNEQNLTALNAGNYQLNVHDANNCLVSSQTIQVENLTAASEENWETGITLHPNPTQGETMLVLKKPIQSKLEVLVYDLHGRLAHRQQFEAQGSLYKLDLSGLAAGLYHVQIKADENVAFKRLVIVE